MTKIKPIPVLEWHGCYDQSWKGVITPESFAHPAKFARGLIDRIYVHCLERGWLRRGDLVGDCFGGIASGGVIVAYRGLIWAGVELEPKFVALGTANLAMHKARWEQMKAGDAILIQGDSRRPGGEHQSPGVSVSEDYGRSAGQIGVLKAGEVSAVITSPPYAEQCVDGERKNRAENLEKAGIDSKAWLGERRCTQGRSDGYGKATGQIGGLKSGTVDGVVTSPPWESNCEGSRKQGKFKDPTAVLKCKRGHGASDAAVLAQAARDEQKTYGDSPGNIGNDKAETYWQAMAQVYASCFLAIKPGGVIACVVKDYVKNKARVPLCDDTARLLEHVGFKVVERAHAMLVKEQAHGDLFVGKTVDTKSRKSFFRRLAESKGSPAIDFEEVIFAMKPL